MRTWLCVLLLCVLLPAIAQKGLQQASESSAGWEDGSVILQNGNQLTGLVRFNAFEGILSFMNGNDSRSLRANSVQAFEYFDSKDSLQRLYYSIPHEDVVNGTLRPTFFEVLKQFENFAVIARISPLSINEKRHNNLYRDPKTGTFTNVQGDPLTKVQWKEQYFVLSEGAEMKEFAEMAFSITDVKILNREIVKNKNKVTDRDVLKTRFAPHYEAMTKYAKENDLEWDERDGLLKLLDYYLTLIK